MVLRQARVPASAALWEQQAAAAARTLTGWSAAWRGLGPWQAAVKELAAGMVVQAAAAAGGCVATMRAVQQAQQWVAGTADRLERRQTADREAAFRERLADEYLGSGGFLHRISKWRAAWAPPAGSICEAPLLAAPQLAVEAEAASWAEVWQTAAQGDTPMWRSARGEPQAEVPPEVTRSV